MKNSILKAAVLGLGLAACGDSKPETNETPAPFFQALEGSVKKLGQVVDEYVSLHKEVMGLRSRQNLCWEAKDLHDHRAMLFFLAKVNPKGSVLGDKAGRTILQAYQDAGSDYAKALATVANDRKCMTELRRMTRKHMVDVFLSLP